jgi:Protein of unknown function (DUF3237)
MKRFALISVMLASLTGFIQPTSLAANPDRNATASDNPALVTEFAFAARVTIDKPLVIGDSAYGLRRVVPITGGVVSGPQLHGKVLPGGADWQYVRADGALVVDAQYTLQTEDGTLIMLVNKGLRHGPKEVIDRLTRGEPVNPDEYYFHTVAEFEAPRGSQYEWLNQSIFVTTAERHADFVIVRFFVVK